MPHVQDRTYGLYNDSQVENEDANISDNLGAHKILRFQMPVWAFVLMILVIVFSWWIHRTSFTEKENPIVVNVVVNVSDIESPDAVSDNGNTSKDSELTDIAETPIDGVENDMTSGDAITEFIHVFCALCGCVLLVLSGLRLCFGFLFWSAGVFKRRMIQSLVTLAIGTVLYFAACFTS